MSVSHDQQTPLPEATIFMIVDLEKMIKNKTDKTYQTRTN